MYTVHFEKCKRLYQSNGFHEKIIFKSMFTHTQVHKHTHTLLKNRKIIAKEKITLLKSEVGIYECQLESQKCNHRCVLPEEDSIDICKQMPLVGRQEVREMDAGFHFEISIVTILESRCTISSNISTYQIAILITCNSNKPNERGVYFLL